MRRPLIYAEALIVSGLYTKSRSLYLILLLTSYQTVYLFQNRHNMGGLFSQANNTSSRDLNSLNVRLLRTIMSYMDHNVRLNF